MTLDSLYIGVPIGAFFCFLFIFFSFLNAGDAKPVRYFRQILLSCLIWTGGVVMMRMQIMPGMRFWFHVSVFGFLTVPIFMYAFLFYMLEIKKNGFQKYLSRNRILSGMQMEALDMPIIYLGEVIYLQLRRQV